jgi:hypothetical protein
MPTVAAAYGLNPERNGMVRCFSHDDRRASAKLYPGRLHCFACNKSWDAVALVGEMFGLAPIDSARRISSDFGLGLFPDRLHAAQQRMGFIENVKQRIADTQLVQDFERQYYELWDFLADFCREYEQTRGDYRGNEFLHMDYLFFEMLGARALTEKIGAFLDAKKYTAVLLTQHGWRWEDFFTFDC